MKKINEEKENKHIIRAIYRYATAALIISGMYLYIIF